MGGGAGAVAAWGGTGADRAVVAASKPNYQDPDQWAPFDPPAAIRKQAATAFKQKITLDLNCDGKPTRAYPDSAILAYGKAYRSMSGDVLIAMNLDPRFKRCGDRAKDDEWKSVLFNMKGDKLRWIGN